MKLSRNSVISKNTLHTEECRNLMRSGDGGEEHVEGHPPPRDQQLALLHVQQPEELLVELHSDAPFETPLPCLDGNRKR